MLSEYEYALWDGRTWDLSLKTDKPVDTYREAQESLESGEDKTSIDSLPNKDWLRAT